ncbi:MAG: rod shape-determining protein MreD, partial [Prevotella sp.]|nr:rod shape-determining protein MreD [Prevotella sp.]
MSIDMLKGISFFVLLLLLQVLVFNHIHLFGFATPLLYVYVMLLFR